MNQKKIYTILLVLILIALSLFAFAVKQAFFIDTTSNNVTPHTSVSLSPSVFESIPVVSPSLSSLPVSFLLNVPYINENAKHLPDKKWKNACEEASIAMVDQFYKGREVIDAAEAEAYMNLLFIVQDQLYGSNGNSDAERSNYLVNNYSTFKGKVVQNPSIEEIKKEIVGGHPVIAFHYGFDLKNNNIPFRATGPSYHSTVIVGYDDEQNIFIVNDPGDDIEGSKHTYEYSLFMNSLHDFDFNTGLADGAPRVIFTSAK